MSKQSEVEKAIKTCIAIEQSCGEFDGNRLTSQILRCLKELQVVIKVAEISDDLAQTGSESPKYFAQGKDIALLSTERTAHIFKAFKDAGCGFFEPLIDEINDREQ